MYKMRNSLKYTIFLLLLLTGVSAYAADGKMSAWLRRAVAEERQQAMRRAGDGQELLTTVFVETDETMTDETLSQYGCKKYAQIGNIAIVTVPLSQIAALAEHTAVKRVEASEPAHTTMDTVPQIINLLPAYETTAQHPAFTGEGVVVGLVDVGFDLTHPTFYNDATLSQYRIKAFWDQLATCMDDTRFPVGRDFVTAEDILAQGSAIDGRTQCHGTHTAGTAVGSGYGSPYRGVAFGSDLCLVANAVTEDTIYIAPQDYYKYTSATDALGFKYLFDYAESQGKPCVVSFSEGYTPYMDEDDRLYSEFIARLTGPGRILVTSAGNENLYRCYANKPTGKDMAGAFIQTHRKDALYRIMSDGPMELTLYAYGGEAGEPTNTLTLRSEDLLGRAMLTDTLFINSDTCTVKMTSYDLAFEQGKTVYQLLLSGNRRLDKICQIALVAGNADSHVEIFGSGSNPLCSHETDPRWNAAEYGHNILAPGCFEAPVTVGSTSHRMQFTNMDGTVIRDDHEETEHRLSWFSSEGPTMDGRNKPDVTAPGQYIMASLSSYYLEKHPKGDGWDIEHFDLNGRTYVWGAYSGTSMSTPIVAGTIALWLQAKPDLTRDDIIGIMQRTCRHPEEGLTYPNSRYGYGEIDAYRGLLDILQLSDIKAISQHQPKGVQVSAMNGQLRLVFDKTPTTPINISVYSTNGVLHFQQQLTVNSQEVTLPLPRLTSGIYAVQLTGDQHTTGSQLIRL